MKKLLLIAILATVIPAGCANKTQLAESANNTGIIEIDTLDIHGTKHEVLFWYLGYKGGMMHSPECWCQKGEKE